MGAKYDLKNIGGIENARNHIPPQITILRSDGIILIISAAKMINKIIPPINPVLSNSGIVLSLYGIKNLKKTMGIVGRFFIKGMIPKIFEEGVVFIILCLITKNKTNDINQTARNGAISLNIILFFCTK
jgi:hypothetical protein